MSLVDRIEQFQKGSMQETEMVSLFQTLIDKGMLAHLPGMFSVIAASLIQAGRCRPPVKPSVNDIELVDSEEE